MALDTGAQPLGRVVKRRGLLGGGASPALIALPRAGPLDTRSVDGPGGDDLHRQLGGHCAVGGGGATDICSLEAVELRDPRDGLHKRFERDPDRIENGRLAAPVLRDEHGEPPVELDLARLETTEVAEREPVEVQHAG